ncbi:hypothetical protein LC613_40000 [Nostoc sphaeroides CHAB 2801]|uniref:hypothetical protein n=1 Tax=Nostoc sphaeroides TaxID=446679 RepID=UPI001E2EF3DD|nr:hypothetical protein [Nostoc sphaeroides]MCC5633622.1 hypothetical protein [Nostoc sphaeroides CHAB 2801]
MEQQSQDISCETQKALNAFKEQLENGMVIVQKSLMLQGKDDNHWMRFYKLDSINHHCFQIWTNDNTLVSQSGRSVLNFLRAKVYKQLRS